MNASSSFKLRSWLCLLLFQVLCFGACWCLGELLFQTSEFKITGLQMGVVFYGVWFVLSILSLVEYKTMGMSVLLKIPCIAFLAASVAPGIFIIIWENSSAIADSGWTFFSQVTLLVLMVSAVALAISVGVMKLAIRLEDSIYPLYEKMGL